MKIPLLRNAKHETFPVLYNGVFVRRARVSFRHSRFISLCNYVGILHTKGRKSPGQK